MLSAADVNRSLRAYFDCFLQEDYFSYIPFCCKARGYIATFVNL